MRIWADVYNSLDIKQGNVFTLVSCTINKALDEIGSLSFSTPSTDPDALRLLTNEARIRTYVEHDGVTRELGRGVIRKVTATMNSGGYTLNFDAVGSMDALNRKNVLLGRSYTNQPIATIAAALTALVSGWSVGVDSGLGNQTARYDGVSVFKALLRTATEKGLHIREGLAANTLDLGAFGDDSGVYAVAPGHNSIELLGNDALVLIESIVQETDSRDVVNWVVPLGAGEGSAALTLKLATATSYPIQTMLAPDGSTLYYLSDTSSVMSYGQIEKIVSFKEIGPVANSLLAKQYAANALYDAAVAWLIRNKDPLVTYRLTVRKPRQVLRPGQKITVTYKGYVETDNAGGELVPINVENQRFWIMKITERVSDSGDVLDLTISSIDRYAMDTTKIVVDAIASMQARNVGVQTFPVYWENTYTDAMAALTISRDSQFRLYVNSFITDIVRVGLRIRTKVLWDATQTFFDAVSTSSYRTWQLQEGYNYPQGVGIRINGINVTSELGGPWAATNAAIDIELDISNYIRNAIGGLYQIHTVELYCATVYGEVGLVPWTGHSDFYQSAGIAELSFNVLALARATVPLIE